MLVIRLIMKYKKNLNFYLFWFILVYFSITNELFIA
jgi:hypothetical protein